MNIFNPEVDLDFVLTISYHPDEVDYDCHLHSDDMLCVKAFPRSTKIREANRLLID